jgi:hypothetical protein
MKTSNQPSTLKESLRTHCRSEELLFIKSLRSRLRFTAAAAANLSALAFPFSVAQDSSLSSFSRAPHLFSSSSASLFASLRRVCLFFSNKPLTSFA